MYKSKRQKNKSFDWYGLSQRFSIRKYHFGAASVLLGTALILGSPQATAKADDTVSTPTTQTSSEQGADAGSSSTTDSLKNVTLPTTASTTEATVLEKPELSAEEIAKATSSETTAATTEKAKEESKPAASDAVVKTNAEEKTKTDKLTEKTEKETKAEEKAEKKEDTASQKTILTQLTSEAEVLNTTAANYAEKKVEDKSSKEAIAAAVAAAKVEIAASKKVLEAENVTKAELDAQLQRISSAIEAVYAEMKRGGHIGKVEAMLADVSATVKTPEKTRVRNTSALTDEEVEGIIRQVRIANPNLTDADKISVLKNSGSANNAGEVTITYANGDTARIASGDAVIGAGVARNVEGLKDAINWFEFSAASIVYPDGTEVGPARYLDTPKKIQVDHPREDGTKVTANLNIVRDVKYADGTTGLTTDDKFLNSGITEFTVHEYYTGGFQNNNEAYEVLKEGMILKVPTRVKGYNLTLRVEKLAPKQVATDPNNTATRGKNAMNAQQGEDKRFKPVKMILTTQDTTNSYLYKAGMTITDKNNRPALATITTNRDGANAGITFSASATFNGRPVPVNLVAADGEESGRAEVLQFETNGSAWKELMSINLTDKQQPPQDGFKMGGDVTALTEGNLDFYAGYTRNNIGYKASEWVNKVQDTDAQGNLRFDSNGRPIMKEVVYGTKLFGPTWNAMRQGNALGMGFSEDVTEFSMYMNSSGAQAGTIGFVVYDGGDAPQSYGSAQHVIGALNRVDSSGRQVVATQPYLGSEPGDPDFRSTATDPSGAWVLDDLVSTNGYKVINMKEGNSVTNEAGETGTYKLVDVNGRKTPVILKADGSTTALKTGEILKINNPEDNFPVKGIFDAASQGVGIGTLPDEGKGQILDSTVAVEYKLRQATDDEYTLDGIQVHPGENNDKAYARGWVDFNNNGKFDEDESSEIVEVTGKQTVSFKFKKTPQLLNTSIDNVGVRLRIALDKKEILAPTGLASSGEVEDFETHVIHPPRGTENKTQDLQGKPQNLTINTTDLFTATGKTEASKYATWNQIDNTVAPKFVVTDSVVASETPTGNTVNITDPSGTTVYNGTEVVIRDARGNELGTAVKITNPLNNTTEYLLSQYTEYDTAGNKVGVYTLNKDNNGLNKAGANGIYKTTIDFQPEKAYVGTAKGVAIRAWDQNGISTGWNASEKTISESKKNITLADKDKILKNVNEGINNRNSMDSTYIPTVVDVRPVGEDLTTTDVQGKTQTGAPKIPAYGTVETVTGEKIVDVKYTNDFVILNDKVKPKFGAIKTYEKDTVVTEPTTITLEDGSTRTYKPTTLPAGTPVFEQNKQYTITGTGDVTVTNVNYGGGTVPTGAKLVGKPAKTVVDTTVIRNGAEVVVPKGERLQIGDVLVTPLGIQGEDQRAFWEITYKANEKVPGNRVNRNPEITLKNDTSVDQLVGKGTTEFTAANGKTYYVGATETIPKGTRVQMDTSTPEKLAEIKLPDAIHIDPSTGVVTSKPRKYTKFTDDEIVIQNEGTYRLNRDTGVVTFTPEPTFVGTGIGVELDQPDIDYNDKVAGDKVTEKYGTDYGHARYTPIVTPSTSASITRTIHYVYENDNDNPSSSDSYKDNKEILAIDGEPVVTKQTLNYTRTYKIFEEDGVLEEATRSAIPVTDATGRTYSVGTEIPAGTKFPKGQVIISEWKAGDQNSVMRQVISPTVKGYTANVVTADFTAANAQGKMGHIHNNKQPVGLYTPVTDNTRDVGEYEPLVSEVTADNTDNFDMYVVYKRDTQKANVVYIDLDEKGDKRVLEIQSGLTEADLTTANKQKDAKTEYNVADLRGKSDTKIPYDTAATIKKYTDKGFELASDDYTNDENGNALANGRNFDEDSTNDQTFYVYLRHKKEQLSKNDVRTVTRHIEYKYADTAEVPADKRGQAVETTLAKKVTEVLTFERTRTIDMAATAKLYETQYNAYKAVAANNAVGSDAEVEARATLFKYVEDKAKEAGATDEAKAVISYGEWQAKPGQATNLTLSAAEENIKDSKFNDVVSPTVPGYLPDNAKVEATADINPESDPKEYTVTVTYSPGDQKAIVNFVEVDATNTDQVITPGLTTPVTLTGKSGTAFPTTASTSVQAKIDELVKKGYELVPNGNGFVSTDSFDTDAAVDQTYTVKLRVKPITVTPNDPTPTPNTPIDPNNPTGPKWTPELIKELEDGRKEEVKRTINYVYADGTKAKDSVEETKEFKRSATINPVTGKITFGEWSAAQTFEEKQSPAIDNYTPNKASVEAKEVTATADDITETVIYSTSKVTVDPNPVDPNENPDPNKVVENDPKKRTLKELGLVEEVKHTIHYVYEDGTKADEDVVQTLTYTRTAKIDPVTGAISDYSTWTAKKGDDFTAVTSPAKEGYIVSKATSTAINDVPATADDTEETIIYRKLGSYIPVVPEGVTVPPGTDTTAKVYPKNPNDPTKPGTPTTTIPEIPGTTPVGPDGTPLTKNPNGGYNVPPVPTDPTQNTTITYVKDGSQVAVTHFIEVNSATDKTEKGAVAQSVVDTGDTGKAFTKGQSVTDTINALKAKGYTVVENGYPTNGTFDADSTTNQEYKVLVTVKPVTITPNTDVPNPEDPNTPADNPIQPGKPIDPTNPEGPKWTKDLIDKLRDARKEEVTRTITYKYSDVTSELKAEDAAKAGQQAADTVTNTVTFKRSVTIDPVTKEFTYGDWEATNGTTLAGKAALPVVPGYVATGDVDSSKKDVEVKATDKDIAENVVYKTVGKYVPVIPEGITPPANTNVDPKPYNNDPQDGSKVKDPDPTNPVVPGTTTPIVPQIPGTTPVGPDGKPLKPVDSNDLSKGYVPPTPTDPTKDTSIIYVKDGSQVAVVHFVDEKGNSVNESVVETGDTGKEISKSNVDAVKAKLEAKGYEVVAPTDALYTTDKEGFYKEATRTFDAVSDKATGAADEKVPSQQYYVIVKGKELPVDPTKPLDPNNNPVDPTNPTPENPTKPRDPETPVTPKPEDKVPNDPKGRTYGELGLVEQVTRTINYVKNDGSKAAEPVKETLTFTRKAKINAVTGEVTYLDNDGNATTKEAAPWTPVNNDTTFDKVTSPSVPDYTPTRAEVPAKENVTATDEDIVETVVYNPTKQTVDPNAPKDPSTPDVTPKPNDVVPNDPKGRTYKELGLIEEVTRTVHYVYEDGTKAAEDKVQTITFTRTAEIDTVTGAISNFGTWTLKDENNTFEPETTEAKDGYIASAAKSTEVTGVQATDKDTEETIIYRKLGSYVPVVPAGVTPPANFDKTPKPYPNATPEDPTRPGTPTTPTTTIPEIPGTTPVGPDGTPLTKNPNGGYDLPPVPTDPTQNTTITYVKDGSQVAVVHFIDEKGNSVNESVVETGDTGKEISKSNVDAVKAKLEAKGYEVVAPTDALYTTDKEGFYKEATRTFDAVSDKATGAADEKVPSQQYYVIVKGKELPVDPTKPLDPNNNPVDPTNPTPENPTKPRDPETPVTPKPEDKVPNDPKGRTYGELGLVEQVTRTINYVKNDGSKAAEPVKETLTFTRKAKINAVTGEVTYLDNDGNATTKEAAPWTPVNNDTTFDKVTSPSVPDYTPTKAEVPAKENVTATDEDIVETVVYNPAKVTVTPNDPNFDPEKPLNPNDPNGLKYKDLKLTEEVTRTITYTYADDVADTSKRGTDVAPKHETTVSFTRTATVNQATGEVTYGDWTAVNNDTTLEGKTELPVIPGYVATGDIESVKKDVANVSATDKDIVEKVVYKDLGKYVPVVPDGTTPPTITDPKYPNNPTDPTKPGEPTTTIPPVDGLTPLDPSTGKPLEPKDPNDLSKGYKPPVPQDPSKDTNIVYVKDGSQVTVVHFVDEDGNAVHTSFVEAGDAGAKFTKAGEVTKVVEELKAAGYTVVPNKAGQAEYPGEAGVFDSVDDKGKDGVSQVYYVTVAKTVPVTPTTPQNPNEDPKNPKPGDPIDPNKPDGPKWTEDALNKLNNIKSVTRTITYVKDGTDEEVSTTEAPKVTNKVSFTRTAIVNPKDGSVVGYDTNGDGKVDLPATDTTSGWAAAGTAKFAEVKSPVVKGYVVKPNQDTQGDLVEADGSKVKASTTDLTVDSPNQDLKVRYVPVGTWTPKVPDGETPIDPIPYPNDPKDPGKVVDPNKPADPNDPNKPSVPVVPHIPGTTPKDPNGNPLKPVDPEDPSKGYVPPTPTTPTENTVIEYVKDDQKAVTKFVDPSGNPIPGVNNIEEKGKSGEPLTKATEVTNEIAKLIAKGYELVSNNYGKDNNGNFDKDSGKDQEYTVVLTPHVEPIKPFDPTNPNDPNKPKPGTPIDPNNPDGPKWTEELIKSLETTKHVTRTISYVDKDGNKVEYTDKDGNKSTADVTDKVTFTREAKINLVTGKIEYGKWTPVNNDTTFDKVTSPVVPGYVLKDPAQKEVAETTGLTENSKDENIKVVYVPVGRLVPKVPDGVTPPTPTPYDNDPQDPGKVVPPSPTKPQDPQDPNSPKVPVIPHIPGTTPKVPQDPTKPVDPNTNPLVPLKPVDPKDPSKGYEVPPVPTNPGTDTPIIYTADKQKAITNFVDNNGKVVSDPVVDQGDSGSKFTKSGEVESKIQELVKKGYIVTSNDYPSADTDRVFDNDKDKDQIFNVKVTPLIVPTDPNSPEKPQVPTDPTKPVGPNNPLKPVTPSNPEPGKPVFPEDPNSPVWPPTVKDLVTESSATRTITYVDHNGKEVAATHTETIKFKRTAKVNLVTGDITYGEWTVVGDDTILNGNKLPKVDGYIARGGDIKESQEDIKAEAGKNITQTVVYAKLGSWIPRLPEGQTNVPPTPYPNDPNDPTKPGSDKPIVPYVPGFTPVDPNGNPLKPVDPNDPTKGYEVPNVPNDPTKDTPINYVSVPQPTPLPDTPKYVDGQRELPNTGTEDHASLAALGLLGVLSGFGLIARKKGEDEE